MMKHLISFATLVILCSCIPFQIAPTIDDYKLVKGKRFKNGLPKTTTFVFEDPKNHGEFYDYINIKYGLNHDFVDVEVPFKLDGETFYFSFYEVNKKSKALFLIPLATDLAVHAATNADEFEPAVANPDNSILEGNSFYIVMEVFTHREKDCLSENYTNQKRVLMYLRDLKAEYLSTHNYNEVVFKNE
ncbi:MAG: hypothetical protein AAGH81_15125 [Bacteroidota bacterium]